MFSFFSFVNFWFLDFKQISVHLITVKIAICLEVVLLIVLFLVLELIFFFFLWKKKRAVPISLNRVAL